MEYIVPIMCLEVVIGINDEGEIEKILVQLVRLEEDNFIASFHQQVEKDGQKVWYDLHVNTKHF